MTVDDIFGRLSQHMIKGLMVHSQLTDYYNFLGFKGYAKCHEYHYHEESKSYKDLGCYYTRHYHKLLQERRVEDPKVIPENWFGHVSFDVSASTTQDAIKKGFKIWVDWERETKQLYESLYNELINIREVAAAAYVRDLVADVSKELAEAEWRHLENNIIDYNLGTLIGKQDAVYEKCKKKLKELKLC